ncbi:glycoside hydrolase family 28 protein [Aquibacillus rhizosphaerae]|uniref:Glycoside hydrolase family 28 protein n=1 Tax=Aquibacillus rhizosphaerae TaxID=3051431 RepID=A0ABT7L335_9BACI|nr:glycoside hydrolase family 28 protein [Aquibacillus sp. LR5S19]MDL4840278.1 glycoside hydrolase family 28 protein [Aquibacillus sp. LR5S19]
MYSYNVKNYGAEGNGKNLNTTSIRKTIEACSNQGGGMVYFPAGTYLTGPIHLESNITLYVDAGATILFTDDFNAYPPVLTRWSGYECFGFSPLIYGKDLKNISIKGDGVIDGQGESWWKVNRDLKQGINYQSIETDEIAELNKELTEPENTNLVEWDSQFLRPALLQLMNCENVTLDGITLQYSPFWNTHLVYCDNVTVHNVTIRNPSDTPNGDGLDIDSCSSVRVSDCYFDVGDDCIAVKSGINEQGRRIGKPSENITITNCTMIHGHGGVVLGSENSGGIQNVTVSNCVFIGTDRGIRLKTNRARGGYIRNILVNNIFMEDVLCPIAINSFYRYGVDLTDPSMVDQSPMPITEKTPVIEHIQISNVTAKKCRAAAGFIYGLPEMPVKDISLRHVTIEMTNDPAAAGGEPDMVKEEIFMVGEGIFCKYVEGIEFHRVRVETRQGCALFLEETKDAEIDNLTMKNIHANTPVVKLNNVEDIYICGRQSINLADEYAALDKDSSSKILFN